jgi:hypothetical protein
MTTRTKALLGLCLGLFALATVVMNDKANAAGLQKLENFTVSCSTDATAIAPSTGLNFQTAYCENNSATSIFYGGSTVTTSDVCLSTSSATCLRSSLSIEAARGQLYCRVASGTASLKCIGGS